MTRPPTRWVLIAILLSIACTRSIEASTPNRQTGDQALSEFVNAGVVVEKVEPGFDGVKSGIKEGDLLLSWSRGGLKGTVDSPFTVWLVELEQRSQGTVTFEGLRGSERRTWTLGRDRWGVKTRPNFAGALLSAYGEGQKMADSGSFSQAHERWQAASGYLANSESLAARVWFLLHNAEESSKVRQWQLADTDYQHAFEMAGDHQLLSSPVLLAWGASYSNRGDPAGAEKCYQQALQSIRQSGASKLQEISFVTAQALISWRRGDLVRAEESYRRALTLAGVEAPNSLELAGVLTNLASVIAEQGDLDKAQENYESALAMIRSIEPDSRSLAATLVGLANLMITRGDLNQADYYYREVLVFQERFGRESPAYAEAVGNLALVEWQRGDLAAAEESLRRATAILEKALPDSLNVAIGFMNLGALAHDRNEEEKAKKYLLRALALERKLAPDSLGVAYCLNVLSLLALKQGDLDEAEKNALLAFAIQNKLAPTANESATSYLNLARISKARGNLIKAEQDFRKALEIQQKNGPGSLAVGQTFGELADVLRARGDLTQAERYYRENLAIRKTLAPGTTAHSDVLANLAAISAQAGRIDAALDLYAEAFNALESQNARLGGTSEARAGFRAKHEKQYREYTNLLVANNQPVQAFNVLERSRARTLLETLNDGQIDLQRGADKGFLERESSVRATINAKSNRRARLLAGQHTQEQLKAVEKEISDLTSEYQDIEAQIRSTSPAYAALTQPQPLTAKEIQQQLLDPETMLLEYSLGEERSFVFAATADSLHAYELPKRTEIEEQARAVHDLLATERTVVRGESPAAKRSRMARNRTRFDRAVASLGRMVLGPLSDQLQNKRLLIVTDGALAYVPFSLLPEPRAPDTPLIVKHEMINLPSASVLAVLRQQQLQRKPAPKAVAVLADPVFDQHDPRLGGFVAAKSTSAPQARSARQDSIDDLLASDSSANMLTRSATDLGLARGGQLALPRLPFSRQEADAILRVTPRGKGLEAVDFNANRATATSQELSQYRIIHFATHGLLNSEHPEISGLVLSLVDKQGRPQNGFLTLQDIYNLNLPADLVVLSACETGLGKEISGEGVIGLTRGFMYAGASRVVASLWKVSDAATAQLMANFYQSMEQGGLSPAAALRAAQIAMWKQHRWRHPYYWAAFQIQGEWK